MWDLVQTLNDVLLCLKRLCLENQCIITMSADAVCFDNFLTNDNKKKANEIATQNHRRFYLQIVRNYIHIIQIMKREAQMSCNY